MPKPWGKPLNTSIIVSVPFDLIEFINLFTVFSLRVYVHSAKRLDKMRIEVVDDLAVVERFCAYLLHLILCKFEIPDGDILYHSFNVGGLRKDRNTALHVPTEHHLSGGLAVFRADGGQLRIGEDTVLTLSFPHLRAFFSKRGPSQIFHSATVPLLSYSTAFD